MEVSMSCHLSRYLLGHVALTSKRMIYLTVNGQMQTGNKTAQACSGRQRSRGRSTSVHFKNITMIMSAFLGV